MNRELFTNASIGNIMGLVLIFVLYFSNKYRIEKEREIRNSFKILVIMGIAMVADTLVFFVDGRPGLINTIIIYVGNSWLYLANVLTIRLWSRLLAEHLGIQISKTRVVILNLILVLAVLCLVANLRYPIVFSVTDNVYQREMLYTMYEILALIYLIDSLVMYWHARRRGGVFQVFPVHIFIIPALLGLVIQSMFYGVSVAWTGVAIAVAGIMTAMKNEIIFTDGMTGLYNRIYLEQIEKELGKKKKPYATGIMIDLNDFKSINDQFGHTRGDEALILSAEIFRRVVGSLGTVIRYAGDEFIIFLNCTEESQVVQICNDLKKAFDEFNQSGTNETPETIHALYLPGIRIVGFEASDDE